MILNEILSAIDHEISVLKQARAVLAEQPDVARVAPKKRRMSAEGRKNIAEAQRKRWAGKK